jgi:hypothetical protein
MGIISGAPFTYIYRERETEGEEERTEENRNTTE